MRQDLESADRGRQRTRGARSEPLSPGIAGAILCLQSVVGLAQDGPVRDLVLDCRQHADGAARLACYDRLADELASAETTTVTSEDGEELAAAVATSAAAPARPPAAEADATVAVRIVDCRRLHDNDYLFTLDNGEYWRQAGGYPLRLGKCDFDAKLVRDFFGHKLEFGKDGRTVRVKRVQ